MSKRLRIGCLIPMAFAGMVAGQEARFEVATIKPAAARGVAVAPGSPDRFYRRNMTLRELIAYASDLSPVRVVEGSEWISTRRWEVAAKASHAPRVDEMRRMVSNLLVERFGLRIHREHRRLPGFELVIARGDRRLGPGFTAASGACRPFLTGERSLREADRDSTGVPACLGGVLHFGERTVVRLSDYELPALVHLIENEVQRPVKDRTGLYGTFDISFDYRPLVAGPRSVASDLPDLSTSLQESLGLKLQSKTVEVEVVVVDAANVPEPN